MAARVKPVIKDGVVRMQDMAPGQIGEVIESTNPTQDAGTIVQRTDRYVFEVGGNAMWSDPENASGTITVRILRPGDLIEIY